MAIRSDQLKYFQEDGASENDSDDKDYAVRIRQTKQQSGNRERGNMLISDVRCVGSQANRGKRSKGDEGEAAPCGERDKFSKHALDQT